MEDDQAPEQHIPTDSNHAPTQNAGLSGTFWIAGGDGARRQGVLRFTAEGPPVLEVQGALTSMLEASTEPLTGGASSWTLKDVDLSVYTLHGLSAAGEPLTLLETQHRAYRGGLFPDQQVEVLQGAQAVIGAHLSGRDHVFTGLRVRLQGANALIPPTTRETSNLDGGGYLTVQVDDEGIWLVLEGLPPASLRLLDRRSPAPRQASWPWRPATMCAFSVARYVPAKESG